MSEYVTAGAMLKCTCGAAPGQLQVTSNTFYLIQGKPAATTNDKAPMPNIMPFGTCSLKPTLTGFAPCVPAPTVWTGFLASVEIGNGNALVDSSTIQCAAGGCISFQNSGQMKPNKVETKPNSPQITALKKAAMEPKPFCEECEKKEETTRKEIMQIYWMDDNGEQKLLSELPIGREVTLCVETRGMDEGETVKIELRDNDGRTYKNGQNILKFTAKVESDNIAYIDNVKIEYR